MDGDPEAKNIAQMEDSRRLGRLALADLLRELGRHDRADEVVRVRPAIHRRRCNRHMGRGP
jgi:hypothetical protein